MTEQRHTVLQMLFILFVSAATAFGQHPFEKQVDPRFPALVQEQAGGDTLVDVIVEFKEEPLLLAHQNGLAAASVDFYQHRFTEFVQTLPQSSPATLYGSHQSEFYKIFFGMGVTVKRSAVAGIEEIPYVKRVHVARTFSAHLEKSLNQMRVPQAWTAYGVKGEGVTVGIIDSGIDYLHPALGGGIGPAFKVLGGFDFVNNDADPMDDYGHGTHVAGIVAADGLAIQGVAPKARLLAFKVLDAQGRGREADILASLERVVDPNQDGDPADMPDVVNMSLGSDLGTPDDAISTAVDNAVKLGITFCVSAGNSGGYTPVQGKENNYYYTGMETIGSPASAQLAITVGAVDSVDDSPRFSSKGPVRGTFGIKPDVMAPGVEVLSLAPGGGLASKSGTSMASPMVAGIAALLKSRNNALTPAEIKSAITNSSLDLGISAMRQGAGRVDAVRALGLASSATPQELSFGLDDPALGVWAEVDTIVIANHDDVAQTYAVDFSPGAAGITLAASPQTFSIVPGGTQQVLVTLTVNNAAIPIVDEDILIFDGAMRVSGASDTLRIPWAFVRTSRMMLSFSHPEPILLGASNSYYITSQYARFASKVRWIDTRHLEVVGAFNGTYDFAVYFPSTGALVTREQLVFQGNDALHFDASEAIHTLQIAGSDEHGVPFPASAKTRRTLRVELPVTFPLYVALPAGESSLSVSPTSARFGFHPTVSFVDMESERRAVLPQYAAFKGISGNMTVTPASATYLTQVLRFRVPPGTPQLKLYSEIIAALTDKGQEYYNTIQVSADTLDVQHDEISIRLALMQPANLAYFASIAFHTIARDLGSLYLDSSTRYFSAVGDSIMVGLPSQRSLVSYALPSGDTLTFGGAPVHVVNIGYNNSFGTSVHFDSRFRGSMSEDRFADYDSATYAIYDAGGQKLAGGPLNVSRSPLPVAPARYVIDVNSDNYFIAGGKGRVRITNWVDLTKQVADAPYITAYRVLDRRGKATDQVAQGDSATLLFSTRIPAFPGELPVHDSTQAFYREHGTSNWTPLPLQLLHSDTEGIGSVFASDLSGATLHDSTGIELRVRVVDITGNATDMIVSPAFAVGYWINDGPLDVGDGDRLPAQYALLQNYPNPFNPATNISYALPVSSVVTVEIFDMLGRRVVTLQEGTKAAGVHTLRFDGSPYASGVYFYRLHARSVAGGGEFMQAKKLVLLR
ncbi:MAG: S8 family serine peptidase [Bacteroidetes bacterium]|nr:S8 family serine peptidase [Bacteroidota bacterium]